MKEESYANFVEGKLKIGQDILAQMTPSKANLLHIGLGIVGEAGELADAIKKHCAYGNDLDVENVLEELGDLEFYMQALRNAIMVNRDSIIFQNVNKLNKRYEKGYSDKEAIDRNDKK